MVARKVSAYRRALNILLLIFVLFFLVQIIWRIGIMPRLKIRRVVLESDLPIGDKQLLAMLDIQNKDWSLLNEEDMRNTLESLVAVREARVKKVFPDTLKVWIARREPLVLMMNDVEKSLELVFFDKEGVVIDYGIGENAAISDLPVVSGLVLADVEVGDQLPEKMRTLLKDINAIRREDVDLYGLISEIGIIPDEISSYYLRVYMNHIPIPLLMNRRISAQLMREALLVLDILASGKVGKVYEADIRGETLVFHSRGAA